jgi:hydrogenase-4 component F
MWVAIEATTLSCGPMIYFNQTARSIEATWKYLLIGSVGIALALLGSFFLACSAQQAQLPPSLNLADLLHQAPHLDTRWLHAAFVLLLVGYGTKMGLAPMHTWKPDAYGEAPGMAGALLAGGVTSCAFLAILRVYQVCVAAGEAAYAGRTLVLIGLISMALAGAFMVGQRDFKRMLAYSSVEHMGILALGIGIGGLATFGALLHMVNNGLAKGVMFLSAGNIHRAYDSKTIDDVRGALRRVPVSGGLFLAGFIAVTGSPPFGPFLSEFTILNGALDQGRYAVSALYLAFLLVVFMGMGATVLTVVQGAPSPAAQAGRYRDGFLTAAPGLAFMALVLMLGLYVPEPLRRALNEAALLLEPAP